jgi:hypothetical protein
VDTQQAPVILQNSETNDEAIAQNESSGSEKMTDTPSFIGSAQAAVETPSDPQLKELETAPFEASLASPPELSLSVWGLLLIVFSIILTVPLLKVQNRKEERSLELWEL